MYSVKQNMVEISIKSIYRSRSLIKYHLSVVGVVWNVVLCLFFKILSKIYPSSTWLAPTTALVYPGYNGEPFWLLTAVLVVRQGSGGPTGGPWCNLQQSATYHTELEFKDDNLSQQTWQTSGLLNCWTPLKYPEQSDKRILLLGPKPSASYSVHIDLKESWSPPYESFSEEKWFLFISLLID